MRKLAVITGATSGIGFSFAKIFAQNGYNLIVLGRNKNILESMKKSMQTEYMINVDTFCVDISDREALEKFWYEIEEKNLEVDVLVNNAGLGYNGEFTEIDFDKHDDVIEINMRALTRLCYLCANHMKKRKKGTILNVASTGSFQAGPMIGVYYASKAYVLSLSVALEKELKEYGVKVCTLCPGATKTNFSKRAGKGDLDVAMSPDDVAKITYRDMKKGKSIIVPGTMNKFAVYFSRIAPYRFTAKMVEKIQKKAINKSN